MHWLIAALGSLLTWLARGLITSFGKLMTNFWAGLLFFLPGIVYKALVGLGVGTATYLLGSFSLDILYSQVEAQLTGLPANMLAFVKMSGIPEGLSILFGALSARITYSALGVTKKTITWNA